MSGSPSTPALGEPSGATDLPTVVIGLPTFRRPAGLQRILPLLLEQARELTGAQARVVVVDNDPDGGAREWVEAHLAADLRYVHEPRPGIAAARNCALDAATGSDVLVCVDDDEAPQPGWLQALVDAWLDWRCAAVTGPVQSVFEGPVDDWVLASGLFATSVRPTGGTVRGADSANLLLDLAALRRHGLRFDEEFGLSGGSDTMLAHTLRAHGEEIRWCQAALISEYVPAARSQRGWVLTRTVRTSNTWSRMRLALAGPGQRWRTRAELTARGLYRLLRGAVRQLSGLLRRRVSEQARGAIDMASGRGLLLGAYGVVRYEYRRSNPATGSSPTS
jgi:succinoglycan biosynthesis protein ExoM